MNHLTRDEFLTRRWNGLPVLRRCRFYGSTAIGIVLAAMAIAPGRAADKTWTGNTSSDWFTGTNWSGNVAPAAGDNVTISTGSAVINNDTPTLGSVTVSNSGVLTKTNGEFTNQGTFTVSRGGTVSFSGGALTKVDGGTVLSPDRLIVTGSGSTFTDPNGIIIGDISAGEVTLADSGKLSAPSVTLANQNGSTGILIIGSGAGPVAPGILEAAAITFGAGDGRLVFNHTATDYVFSTKITGAGTIFADAGTTKLTADSSGFSGEVDVNGGTLRVNGALGTSTSTAHVYNGALVIENGGSVRSDYAEVAAFTGETASAKVTGAGSHWTTNNLVIGYQGTSALTVENQGKVDSLSADIGSRTGSGLAIVSGSGSTWNITNGLSVASTGPGTLQVENGATVSAGAVMIGSRGSLVSGSVSGLARVTGAGSLLKSTGDIYLGGDAANPVTPGPVGTLIIADAGRVSTPNNFWIATQTGSTGTLNIGAAAGAAAAAPGTVDAPQITFGQGTGKIVFNHTAADYVFAPAIASNGGGEVDVLSGTTTLTATNTYTGPTNVNGGKLLVNGSIVSSPVTVYSGGTLGGTGTVGNTTVASGGTFAPGNGSAGSSITVQGSLAFQSGALYLVQLDPSMASSARVSGTATLTGATVNAVFAPGSYVEKRYTILTADGGLGSTAFAGVSGAPTNFVSALSYDTNNAFLDLTLSFPTLLGLNRNQQAVANTLTNFFNTTGGIPLAFGSLSPQGLTQVSGELATGAQQTTFQAQNLFLGLLTDPFVAGRSGGSASPNASSQYADDRALNYAERGKEGTRRERDAYAAIYRKAPIQTFEERWSVWGVGYGGSQTTSGNAGTGSNTATSQIYGGAAGADYRLSPHTLVGFALAGGGTNFNVANSGTGRSDLFQAGAFLRHEAGPAYVTAAFAYGWQNITTDRTVTAAGMDRLHASFDASAYSGRIESGYRFVSPMFGGLGLTPYAAGQVTLFDLPSYAEQALSGSNQFALTYPAKDATATRSELGLRVDKSFALSDTILTLRGRAAWAHNFDPDHAIGATFQTLPGASFVVNGAAQANDAALVTALAEAKWLNGWSVAGTIEGEFSNVTNSYAGKGVIRYAW
jgi:T5SS/PEP-CTERM-associated repeat protein/autotransporter-associated beta strand protein